MKFIALLLSLISLSTYANTQGEFKHLINDLQYQLTVEWDQRDQAFYSEATGKFEAKVKALFEKGLTKQELQAALKEGANSAEALAKIELLIRLNKIETPQELMSHIRNNSQDFYQRGANWNGEVHMWVIGSVLLAAVISGLVLLITYNWPSFECTSRSETQTCVWVEDSCMSYDENGQCYSYHTPYESCSYGCLAGYWTEGSW